MKKNQLYPTDLTERKSGLYQRSDPSCKARRPPTDAGHAKCGECHSLPDGHEVPMENAIAYDVSEDLKGTQWTGTLLLAENEQQHLIMWSATAQLFSQDVCVPQLVELQAAATPDTVVVVMDNHQLT